MKNSNYHKMVRFWGTDIHANPQLYRTRKVQCNCRAVSSAYWKGQAATQEVITAIMQIDEGTEWKYRGMDGLIKTENQINAVTKKEKEDSKYTL